MAETSEESNEAETSLTEHQGRALDRALIFGLAALAIPAAVGMVVYLVTLNLVVIGVAAVVSAVGFLVGLWWVSRVLGVPFSSTFHLSTLRSAALRVSQDD